MFNEKEIFSGIGIFIVIGSLLAVYFVLNSEDKINSDFNLPNKQINENSITGKIINLFSKKETNYCGDGYCYINENGDYENCNICSSDCGTCEDINKCGDNICSIGECNTCFSDCSLLECENGICEQNKGENCVTAPNDCKCEVDSYCDKGICTSLSCGNGICEQNKGESCQTCSQDCGFCDCNILGGNSCEVGQECNGEIKDGCCLGACEWKWQYPLVFVHGHSMTEGDSLYSIATFDEFQNKLISDGYYVERESIIANDERINFNKNQWANTELPISVRTTYYFGEYSSDGGFTYRDNNQEIEEYAERLEKIIDLVIYTTGREKVDIVAHSMGGLVARKYIVNTEGKYVNKLVTIGTPNNGVYGYVAFGCEGYFGRTQKSPECNDMQFNSSFFIELEKDKSYRNRYLTIAGKAEEVDNDDALKRYLCPDGKSYHDEVVCSTSVFLEGAKNDYVFGKQIAGIDKTFHGYLVSPSKVSEVYNKVVDFLKN